HACRFPVRAVEVCSTYSSRYLTPLSMRTLLSWLSRIFICLIVRIEESMSSAPAAGTAPFALSVLDNAHTAVGQDITEAFEGVIDLARRSERRGYRRFWMSEHHAIPGAATSSPQLMLARLIAETSSIRLGAGGIMLPNHAPLIIAEQFGMLEALAPGRIDLGLGRAPGTDTSTAAALRRGHDANDHFPAQVDELLRFLADEFPAGHPYRNGHEI